MDNFKKLIKEALTPHHLRESVNESKSESVKDDIYDIGGKIYKDVYTSVNLTSTDKTVRVRDFERKDPKFKLRVKNYIKSKGLESQRDGNDFEIYLDKGRDFKGIPLSESVNEDFTHSSLTITDQSQISGLDDSELLDLLNKVSYEYTPELKDSARIITQEIEDRDLTNKIHYVDNERYEFRESVNEDIQPLAVEELTDEALLDMLNNIDDMSRDKKGGTYDMSGRKMTRAQYDLAKSLEAEVRRREKERGLKIHSLDIDDSYEIGESVNENLVAAIAGMVASTNAMLGSPFERGLDGEFSFSIGTAFKNFINDFKIKRIVKRLIKDPEIIDLVNKHTNVDKDNKVISYSNLKGIQNILKNKLKPNEMKYLKIGWGPHLRKAMKLNEDIVDDKAKIYWLQKLKRGEIDTLPDNPRMEYLRHAMRDQLAQDKEQLSRERGLVQEASYDEVAMREYGAPYDELSEREKEWVRDKIDMDRGVMEEESVNEGFEWYQPLLALGGSVGLMATALFAIIGPSTLVGGAPFGGDSWGDVFRHYKKKFKDKQAAKNLRKEDIQELVNLIQTNIDTSDLNPGVKRYMKRLMNELENEMNKDEEELDKNKLLVLLRNVENYAKRKQVSINEAKTESELKDAWREWNKKHPKDQIDWGEYREEHGEHLDEVTKKEIDDIENSGNIDIAYKKAMKLLKSLKDESVNEGGWKTQGHRKGWKANPKPKQDQLQAAIKAYDKAESEGDIRGMELALAAVDMLKDESVNESVYGSVGFTPSDKDAKPEHPNWRDLSAEEIQDYIDANPSTLWGRSLSIAKMVLRDKKRESINEPKDLEMSDEEEHEHVKNLLKRNFMDESEARINELFGIGGPSPRDKKNQAARQRSSNKTANYHDLLKYYQFGIARIPRHKREKAGIPQAMHDRYGQEVWDILKKAYPNKGLNDTPPPGFSDSADELIMALGDEGNFKKTIYNPFFDIYAKLGPTDSHKKQLGIEEESDTGGETVNPVNLDIDEELTSLTPNEIGDESKQDTSASGAYESKEFDFKKMVKEALKSKYLR